MQTCEPCAQQEVMRTHSQHECTAVPSVLQEQKQPRKSANGQFRARATVRQGTTADRGPCGEPGTKHCTSHYYCYT